MKYHVIELRLTESEFKEVLGIKLGTPIIRVGVRRTIIDQIQNNIYKIIETD